MLFCVANLIHKKTYYKQTLKTRQLRRDLAECFKKLHSLPVLDFNTFFLFSNNIHTRSHCFTSFSIPVKFLFYPLYTCYVQRRAYKLCYNLCRLINSSKFASYLGNMSKHCKTVSTNVNKLAVRFLFKLLFQTTFYKQK